MNIFIFILILIVLNLDTSKSSKPKTNSKLVLAEINKKKHEAELVVHAVEENEFYLYTKEKFRLIPSRHIALELGWDEDNPDNITSIQGMPMGDPIPSFYSKNQPGLERFLDEINYFNNIFKADPPLIFESKLLPRYEPRTQNAAILPYHGKFLVVRGDKLILLTALENGVKDPSTEIIPMESEFKKQDLRIYKIKGDTEIMLSGTITLIQLNGRTPTDVKMGYIRLLYDGLTDKYRMSNLVVLLPEAVKGSDIPSSEKNWGPMTFNNKIHFVYSITPLTIVEISEEAPKSIKYLDLDLYGQYVKIISTTNCLGFNQDLSRYHDPYKRWRLGSFRGGTPALLIRGEYLAFFHSRVSKSSKIITQKGLYIMGAYTFTATPSFKLTAHSPRPIVDDLFLPTKGDPWRLVVFPLVFYLDDGKGNEILEGEKEPNPSKTTIVLTLGLNDGDTAIVKMNLNNLLASLRPVTCLDNAITAPLVISSKKRKKRKDSDSEDVVEEEVEADNIFTKGVLSSKEASNKVKIEIKETDKKLKVESKDKKTSKAKDLKIVDDFFKEVFPVKNKLRSSRDKNDTISDQKPSNFKSKIAANSEPGKGKINSDLNW